LDFFRDPSIYEWVKLECDDPKFAAIDDVIARRRLDGKYEVTQVKFTVDPARDDLAISWEWLLQKKEGGTSLLEKWAKGLSRLLEGEELHSARLATNRRPDAAFSSCLENSRVNLSRVERTLQSRIVSQIGNETAAHRFFSTFKFDHSQPLIDDLEIKLRNRVVPADTDESGWLLFLDRAKTWATRRNEPEVDGCIRHKHLVQVLSQKRPKPISQDFKIPDGYIVPDENFDQLVKQRITSVTPVTVIWGSPGRGKSTYLSNLVEWLSSQEIPYIRHHYFLDLADNTGDRISYTSAAGSLIDQIRFRYRAAVGVLTDNLDSLDEWIRACGDYFQKEDKPFVVIIDGLDHVWREGRQMEQMHHLFSRLLPASPNVCCIFGTQKVSDEHLPSRLLTECPKEKWLELPLLSRRAIGLWLGWQIDGGRIEFPKSAPKHDFEEVVDAVSEVTKGHPLHLIFSVEQLIRSGRSLTPEEILSLPPCPDGDIKRYYQLLWGRLGAESKAALHLMAGLRFNWPSLSSLRTVSAKLAGPSLLSDIDHLIERRQVSVMPFHGSILAWVQERDEHDATMAGHYPNVIEWLENDAPPYWQWAWLWVTKSDFGKHDDLLNNPSRAWVVDSLCRGYQPNHIELVLSLAARVAFDQKSFARCLQLKSLATRVMNGPEFQTHDFPLFQEATLGLTDDTYPIEWMAENVPTLSEAELLLLARHPVSRVQQELIDLIGDELTSRQAQLIEKGFQRWDELTLLIRSALRVSAISGKLDPDRAIKAISQFPDGKPLFEECLDGLIEGKALRTLISFVRRSQDTKFFDPPVCASAIVRLLCSEGAKIADADVFPKLASDGLFQCWCVLSGLREASEPVKPPDVSDAIVQRDDYGISPSLVGFFRRAFFSALSAGLQESLGDTATFITWPDDAGNIWLRSTVSELVLVAKRLAAEVQRNQLIPGFGYVFEALADIPAVEASPNDKDWRQYLSFKTALLQIAQDIHFLGMARGGAASVSLTQYELAASSAHWSEDLWLERYLLENAEYFSAEAISGLLKRRIAHLDVHVTQYDERTLLHSQLACIAMRASLKTLAQQTVKRAASCLVGYGYRKDYWLWDVISSIHHCASHSSRDARDLVRMIAPIVDSVDAYTDRDEIPHAKDLLTDAVADAAPEMLSSRYSYFLDMEEWSEANHLFDCALEKSDLDNPVWAALAATAIDQSGPWKLKKRAEARDAGAQLLVEEIKLTIGAAAEPPRDQSTPLQDERLDDLPDFGKFPPEQLACFLDDLDEKNIIVKRGEALLSWAEHWKSHGRASCIKVEVQRQLEGGRRGRFVEELLDFVFEDTLVREGRSEAFPWLVRAHRYRNGWSRWTGQAERKRRLDRAAEIYPSEWERFLIETSIPTRRYQTLTGSGPIMGTDDLVYYLLKCRQVYLAFEITREMVETTVHEFEDQPLGKSPWVR